MQVQLKNIVKEYPNPAGALRVLNNVTLDRNSGHIPHISCHQYRMKKGLQS
jgi:hypothetical protein